MEIHGIFLEIAGASRVGVGRWSGSHPAPLWQSAGPPPQIDFQGRQIENQAGLENAEA